MNGVWVLLVCLLPTVECGSTLAELLGMESTLLDLAKTKPALRQDSLSAPYKADPSLVNFLKMYRTRSEFCRFRCQAWWNISCYAVLGCINQIRNFVLIILVPLLLVVLTGVCCSRGLWTLPCWAQYIALMTGYTFIAWMATKLIEKYQIRSQIVRK